MKKILGFAFVIFLGVGLGLASTVSAQTALTRQASFGETAAAVTFTAVDGASGNKVLNTDGKTILQIKNASGGSITATIAVQNANPFVHPVFGKVTKTSIAVVVTAGNTFQIGPLPAAVYNDNNGYLQITYTSGTSVTAAAFATP